MFFRQQAFSSVQDVMNIFFKQLFKCSFDLSSASANIYAQIASNDRCYMQRNYDSEMQLNTTLKALLAWLDSQ